MTTISWLARAAGLLALTFTLSCTERRTAPGVDLSPAQDGGGSDLLGGHDLRADGAPLTDLPQTRPDRALPPDRGHGNKKCGPWPGGQCSGKGQVCDIRGCGAGTGGNCVKRPTKCGAYWSPVCGCDGVTYSNDCMRLAKGAPLAYKGSCKKGPDAGGTSADASGAKCKAGMCSGNSSGGCGCSWTCSNGNSYKVTCQMTPGAGRQCSCLTNGQTTGKCKLKGPGMFCSQSALAKCCGYPG